MTGTQGLAVLVVCIIAYVIARDVLRAPAMRRLEDRLTRERNRNRFGEVRTRLVRVAVEGGIDPKSHVFAGVYKGSTALMRNPYEFEAAANAILTIPLLDQKRRPKPTKTEGAIARDFAHRIDLLCRDYSKWYRATAWLLDRCTDRKLSAPLWVRLIKERAERRERIRPMLAARERLERTAQLAA